MIAESRLFREAAEAASVVERQLETNRSIVAELAQRLRELKPRAVVTCARGSSDHAATYAKYLIETRTGLLASSAAPSISSIYATRANLDAVLFLAISQSGASPDLLASVNAAKKAGAHVVALVNDYESPLARAAHHTIPLRAGAETSVAATKSYIASLAAIVDLVAAWTDDGELAQALAAAPAQLAQAWRADWSAAIARLKTAESLYVVGRGLGLGIAQEAALKLKETSGLHAEAFSAAELKHGPLALVRAGFPVLLFAQRDETHSGVVELAAELAHGGADVRLAGGDAPGALLLPTENAHPAIEPMLRIQSFYRLVDAVAVARGRDPDHPPHLSKVTATL